ncbi:MAG: hypothetical protein R2764_10875 [Bacteroidales bacterium]
MIALSYGSRADLNSNILKYSARDGIYATSNCNINAVGNTIGENQRYGIQIHSADTINVNENPSTTMGIMACIW